MDEKNLKALAAELAKGLKTEADLNQFSRMLTKLTVDAARSTSHIALYRLERLEFRRIISLSHQKGNIPLVIFTLLNKTTFIYAHCLGDIVFSYNPDGVTELVSVTNNLNVLY